MTHSSWLCASHGALACEDCSVFLQQWRNMPLAINFSASRLRHCCVPQSTVELLHSLYRTLRMQSVKHGCCTLVFYFSKLDCKTCFLITVSRFAFPRFVLEKGLSCIFVTYGNALWFIVLIEIVNISYTFFCPLLFLSSSAVVAFICSGNVYSRACSTASRRQQFWHS